ncbi:unnamed protein product [Moneuplotes crassus]|uniref:Nucleosome assembly protein n=1 Tax=Euplotes crassus TaxID=5936 RepID=A0AAD1XLX6_EUPCR|nr:unnamed protein product [Moneuplotes crassus]
MEVETTDDKIKDDQYYEQRLNKVIMSMPEDVRDRFKLLKVISSKKDNTVEQIRKLNLKYEQIKAPLYDLRLSIINGESFPDDYLNKFDLKHEQLRSELGNDADGDDCAAVEIKTDDLVDQQGVPGFWLKVLKAHTLVRDYIKKHDEPILKHLANITGEHFPDRCGYELVFTFSENEYMTNTELRKVYHMIDERILEKVESSSINWREGKDPTKKMVKKKQKNKKTGAVRTVMKKGDQASFFTFFKSITMPPNEEMDAMPKEEQDELTTKLDEDFDLANDIINELIPEALEFYLGVVDDEFSDLDSHSDEDENNDGEGEDAN